MSSQAIRRAELKDRLEALRPLLEQLADSGYLTLFDEFVDQTEFGLALHCVCDHLLEPRTSLPPAIVLECIAALHSAMEIKDECVELLRKKVREAG